jgi:pimeloyl-ACP methyl ester carboxylesterase
MEIAMNRRSFIVLLPSLAALPFGIGSKAKAGTTGGLQVTELLDPGPAEPCCLGFPGALALTRDFQVPPPEFSSGWESSYGRISDPAIRFFAQRANTRELLTNAVKMALGIPIFSTVSLAPDPKYIKSFSQLAVTGRRAFASFAAWHPQDADLTQEVIASNPTVHFDPTALEKTVKTVLDFAYTALWAIRANDPNWRAARANLGWIATSGEDDLPHRPVNVPSAPYPQFDIDVVIPGQDGPITVTTRYIVAKSVNRLLPQPVCDGSPPPQPPPLPPPGRSLPVTDPPDIAPDDKILIYLHGGSSRLEEGIRFFDELVSQGRQQGQSYAVIAMDLLNSGYSTPIEHTRIAVNGASYWAQGGVTTAPIPPWPAPTYGYPMMDTEEQFILNFIDALDAKVGNIKKRIAAVMGGSLGGNMALRLGRRSNTSPFLSTIVAWSVTCIGEPFSPLSDVIAAPGNLLYETAIYETIKGTVLGCGADLMNKYMAPEAADSRSTFFDDLYNQPTAQCKIPVSGGATAVDIVLITQQPKMWYGDSWRCKELGIRLSQFDRYEYYTSEYRRWTIRLNFEMAVYSFQEGDLFFSAGSNHPRGPARYLSVNSRLLLASGAEDNYDHVKIFDNTKQVAAKMVNTPGTTLFLANTGHSIYEERPKLFASKVLDFIKTQEPKSNTSWLQVILDEASGN